MFFGLEDMITISLFILATIIVFASHIYIKQTFAKYRTTSINRNITGFEVARRILDHNGLNNVHIVAVNKDLADHYDPTRKVIRLSNPIFNESSVAAVAVAAHEVGHAIQDKEKYVFMKIRSGLVPVVSFISYLGFFGLFVAIFAGITEYLILAILILLVSFVFQLITLPVEFDASKRANKQLIELGIIDQTEQAKVKTMLNAAALTYVAALVSTLLYIIRLILMTSRR